MKSSIMSRCVLSLALTALLCSVGNLFAGATVAWVSGGPNPDETGVSPLGAGYSDGDITSEAEYNTPGGIAMDITGNYLILADQSNNVVRVLQFNDNQTYTLAAYVGNDLVTNYCNVPVGVAIDSSDDVFVLNHGNGKNGSVIEVVDSTDTLVTNAMGLTNANGIALDSSDNIYVTVNSNKILEITSPGVSNVIATVTNAGALLQGLVVRRSGMIAACDSARDGVYQINPTTGAVSTNAGFNGQGDFPNNSANNTFLAGHAQFFQPMGVTETGDGNLVVADYGNSRVKVIEGSGAVTNLYGVSSNWWSGSYPGFFDGTVQVPDSVTPNVQARLPNGVAMAPDGSVYVTEDYYNIIRHVSNTGFAPPPTPPPPAPATPTGLTATTNATSVTLTWNGSAGATNYTVSVSQTLGENYTPIDNTSLTTFTDTNVVAGATYYFVVSASNTGGTSTNSAPVEATIPIPPPGPPTIGWFDYELNSFGFYTSVLHPVSGTPFVTHNDLMLAINPNVAIESGLNTYYIDGPPPLTNNPSSTNGSSPPEYVNGAPFDSLEPLQVSAQPDLVIESVNENGVGEYSSVVTAEFLFEVANPTITGNNAAQFEVSDITTNVSYWYTIDGSTPTNDPDSTSIGPIVSTNGQPITLSLNGSTNFLFQIRGFKNNYFPSGIASATFLTSTFVPNTISFGFASGEASSGFVASPGQTFYAPITLTTLPGQIMDQLDFNVVVTNAGPNPGPPITPGAFDFQSMLMQPVPGEPNIYTNIPPYEYVGFNSTIQTNRVFYNGSTNFITQEFTNISENLLALGWIELQGQTNLFNTKSQTLITYSIAHDDLFPNAALGEPNGVIVGGYSFDVPVTATSGQTYQIGIGAPSATTDGQGGNGSAIFIYNPTNNSLGAGSLNALKNVTIGQNRYIVGDVYPFRWFNAGDFGESNLIAADVAQIFEAAIYDLNVPPFDPTSAYTAPDGNTGYTNVSDMYDAMDSCGATYVDLGHGYLEKDTTVTAQGALNALFSGNDQTINQIAFGDGVLDVCDVYVTYRRSEDPSLVWFQRFWTNGVRVAVIVSNTITPSVVTKSSSGGKVVSATSNPSGPISITNTPTVNFTTEDYLATAGQTLNIPINATVFGQFPLRVAMINVSVNPLDGSPPLTTQVSFAPAALGAPYVATNGINSYGAAWLNSTIAGITNNGLIGTLTVTIPSTATAMSSYAIYFNHASGSPNGIASFTRHTLTGLITLSSRTNSTYNDGIPDSWRLRYFGSIYNYLSVSNADADGTGMENWQKYQAGLNPTDPTSVLTVGTDQVMAQSLQDSVIDWPTVNGQTYVIERATSLFPANWVPVATVIGDGTYMEIHDNPGSLYKYYQVVTP
jgi:hypothetical protein